MDRKVKILVAGELGASLSAAALSALKDKDIELVDIKDSYYEQNIPIKPRPTFNVFGERKEMPTCERNHEYVRSDGGIWECRFCKRKL
jgi:hypothetical protein